MNNAVRLLNLVRGGCRACRSREETRAIFERYKPTYVIHLAALVGGLFRNMKQKVEFYRENVLINDNVMEACKDYKVRRLVACRRSSLPMRSVVIMW